MEPKDYSTIRSILKREQGEKIAPYVFKITDTEILKEYLDKERITYEIYQRLDVNSNTVPRTKSPQFLSHIMVRRVVANTLVLRMSTFFFKNSLINFTSNSYHSKALFLFYNMVSNENKPPRKELTDAQRNRIIGAYECGVKGSAIVEQLGLPPSTVYDTIKRYNKTGSHTLKIALADQKSSMSAMNALWYALPILLVISPLPTLQGSSWKTNFHQDHRQIA